MRVCRPAPQREFDAIDRFVVSFDQRFDASVGQVTGVAMDPFGRGACGGKHPKADALHASANEQPSRHDHKPSL